MALSCVRQTEISGYYDAVNDVVVLPIKADVTGTWTILFDDDSTDTVVIAAVGEYLSFDIANFTNDTEHLFKLIKPNNATYGNTCYNMYLSYEDFEPVAFVGLGVNKIDITLDSETASEYVNGDLANLGLYAIFREGSLVTSGVTYDEETGTFTWSFTDGDDVSILYFKQ